jgi:hypothetical protein
MNPSNHDVRGALSASHHERLKERMPADCQAGILTDHIVIMYETHHVSYMAISISGKQASRNAGLPSSMKASVHVTVITAVRCDRNN